jgi:hypothetical protein
MFPTHRLIARAVHLRHRGFGAADRGEKIIDILS